jgi:hypothetical protein
MKKNKTFLNWLQDAASKFIDDYYWPIVVVIILIGWKVASDIDKILQIP